jgi:hypothetical protein
VDTCLLPGRSTAQRCHDFLDFMKLCLCEAEVYQHSGDPAHYAEDVREGLNAKYPGRLTGRRRPTASPSFVAGSISDGFYCSVGTSEGLPSCSLSQNYRSSCGRTSTSCDNGRRQRVEAFLREYRAPHTAACASNTYCTSNYEALMICTFDSLRR